MPGPLNDIIMRLMAQGGKRGLPMTPSPELLEYLARSKAGISSARDMRRNPNINPDQTNLVDPLYGEGPGFQPDMYVNPLDPPPISQDPWFNDPASLMADEARLPPRRFQQEAEGEFTDEGLRPEDVMTPAGMPRPGTGPSTGNYYIWATNSNGTTIRVDGPFNSEIEAARELKLMEQTDPEVVRTLKAFVAPQE